MRELNIACANSRSTKQLTNKKITLSALKERLKVTIRTTVLVIITLPSLSKHRSYTGLRLCSCPEPR